MNRTPRVRDLRGDAGSVALPLVIVFPVLVFFMMLIVQYAMWAHARNIAIAAAQDAAAEAAAGGTGDVRGLLDDYGGANISLTEGPEVAAVPDADGGPGRVTVRFTGTVPTMFDLFDLPIRVEASAPAETFYP